MTDVDIQKRRFMIFLLTDLVMAVIALSALFIEFVRDNPAARPFWVLALVVGFGVQLWFIMGFRKAQNEKGK